MTMFRLGIENFLSTAAYKKKLKGRRLALLGHPASTNRKLRHSIDLIHAEFKDELVCVFGPQHGMRGEKQDNMIESEDFLDPVYKIPVFSLYGKVRRPTKEMLSHFDVILVDLQDVGCRIYTFLTTLFYLMDECDRYGKEVWVLDRPNPAGRPAEGFSLDPEFESFVGAAPLPMRHGLTLGEAGLWYKSLKKLKLEYKVVQMSGYAPEESPGYGWPIDEISWVNPSPNMPRLSAARMYAGTVMIEGTKLSEGRGTTTPLELIGAPDLSTSKILNEMGKLIPAHLKTLTLRPCYFEPTFQKHAKKLCSGFQIHIDHKGYSHNNFKPFRLVCAFLKALRKVHPDYDLWLSPPYEYEEEKMPIDILSGSSRLREWVDNPKSKWQDLEKDLNREERHWLKERKIHLLY